MEKQILGVNTFKFPGSGKTLDEAVKENVHADRYFNTEEKYLKTLISESCKEGYHYPGNVAFPSRLNEKEAEVLKKIADAAERPGADLKQLTMEAVIDAALGKLAKRCTDQDFKIKQLESQLHFYKSNSIQQQKSRSDDSGMEY